MSNKPIDVITMGRVSMDLFSQNIGVPFDQVKGFDTGIGGSPTNIAVGTSRLGLNAILLTAVGPDETGNFVRRYLANEGIDTQYIPVKSDTHTGLAIVAVQPPDKFPLTFYRDNPADIYLTIDDVDAVPIAESKVMLLSGTALSRGSCRDATLYAAEQAQRQDATVFMDLDLRPDQWTHTQAFHTNIATILPKLDVVIGTEEEFYAALSQDASTIMQGQAVTEDQAVELETLIQTLLTQSEGPATLVLKRGARGVSIYQKEATVLDVPGFPVEILNTVGAGDAFASGLIYGFLKEWDWYQSARMANACGAIVVTRHGCSNALPTEAEVLEFVDSRGGF
ncbi:MAG: 5-dehydro-2-deoxygluconokinase [Chloroflexota bacterium]